MVFILRNFILGHEMISGSNPNFFEGRSELTHGGHHFVIIVQKFLDCSGFRRRFDNDQMLRHFTCLGLGLFYGVVFGLLLFRDSGTLNISKSSDFEFCHIQNDFPKSYGRHAPVH